MTTDDRLLLTDLERIAATLAECGEFLNVEPDPWDRKTVTLHALETSEMETKVQRARREMVDFRKRLEWRLNS